MDDNLYIGIDYGTSNIKAAYMKKDIQWVFKLDNEEYAPNVICRIKNKKANDSFDYCIGSEAVNKMIIGEPGYSDVKRYFINEDYRLTEGEDPVSADELATETFRWILDKITKNRSKNFDDIKGLVITAPVCFGERQRRRIARAARKAGANVTTVVSEPVAGLFSFEEYRDFLDDHRRRRIMVIDIGGGTTDLALAELYYKKSENISIVDVKAAESIPFGGNDITNGIIEEICIPAVGREQYESQRYKFFYDADKIKQDVFLAEQDKFWLRCGKNDGFDVSYEKVVEILQKTEIKEKLLQEIDEMLDKAELFREDIDKVYFIGGGAFIGELRRAVEDHFDMAVEQYDYEEDALTATARGAAELSRILADNDCSVVLKQTVPYPVVSGSGTEYIRTSCCYDTPGRMHRIQREKLDDGEGIRFFLDTGSGAGGKGLAFLGTFAFGGKPYDNAEYLELTLKSAGGITGTFYDKDQNCLGQYNMDMED